MIFNLFKTPPKYVEPLVEEYSRDVDILKTLVTKKVEDQEPIQCTLEEETKPPAYRKEVIQMMESAKRKQKEKYPQNTGLSYYPFQK